MNPLCALRQYSLRDLVSRLLHALRACARPTARAEGNLRIDTATFAVDDQGLDPRVHCHSCDRRSNCPAFDWI